MLLACDAPLRPRPRARAWLARACLAVALAAGVLASGSAAAEPGRRVALVVGNSAYQEAPLKNPVNDARAMSESLAALGFEVTTLIDVDHQTLEKGIVGFGASLEKDSAALFYYAGHGLQVRGRNYLVPVDASFERENEVRIGAVDVDLVLSEMEWAGSRINIVILDACRNNPFERRFRGSASRGLAAIDAARGTVVAYATAPGAVAADGSGNNGVYTEELLDALQVPGLSVEEVFKRVRVGVAAATGDRQIPWESSSLTGDFVFHDAPAEPEPAEPVAASPAPASASRAGAADALFWESVKDSDDAADYQLYLDAFPEGLFAGLAARQIAKLEQSAARGASPGHAPGDERVERLLALANADIVALRLTSPPGTNAVQRLRAVLEIEPGNVKAHDGLARVVARYVELAERSIGQSRFDRAQGYIVKAESVSPRSEAIVAARDELERARADAADASEARRAEQARREAREGEALEREALERATRERAAETELAAIREELAGLKSQQRAPTEPASAASPPVPEAGAPGARPRVVILPGRVTASYSAGTTYRALQRRMKGVAKVLRRDDALELTFAPTDDGADAALERRLDALWTSSVAKPEIDVSRATSELRAMGVDIAIAIHLVAAYNNAGRARVQVLDVRTGELGNADLHLREHTMLAAVREAYGQLDQP